jgi:hypothetical protein
VHAGCASSQSRSFHFDEVECARVDARQEARSGSHASHAKEARSLVYGQRVMWCAATPRNRACAFLRYAAVHCTLSPWMEQWEWQVMSVV